MVKKNKSYIFFLLIFMLSFIHHSKAQTDKFQRLLDSLINVFPKQKNDSAKALIAINIVRLKMGGAQTTGN